MNYKELNKHLKNLNIRNNKPLEKITTDDDITEEIYKIKIDGEDIFIKITVIEDSYGGNQRVIGIEFVKPFERTVLGFEAI